MIHLVGIGIREWYSHGMGQYETDIVTVRDSMGYETDKVTGRSCYLVTGWDRYISLRYTGHSRYVDFAYLDTTTYVEVIFHSQHFFSIFLSISTPSMSKTFNMKQQVSRGDFSCPRHIFYYICHCLCRSIKSALAWAPYCLLQLYTCISSSK